MVDETESVGGQELNAFPDASVEGLTAAEEDPGPPVTVSATEEIADDSTRRAESDNAAEHDFRESNPATLKVDVKVDRNDGGMVAGYVRQVVRREMDANDLKADYVEKCEKTFAAPEDFSKARRTLFSHHVVVVVAEQDTGQHHAAVALLAGCDGVVPRQVRREPGDRIDWQALEMERNSGWLLDLRNDSELHPSFGLSLSSLQGKLRGNGSYLVVIVRPIVWFPVRAGAAFMEYKLTRVPASEIVRKELSVSDSPIDPEPYFQDSRLLERVELATPEEAIRHADLIAKIHYSDDKDLALEESGHDVSKWTSEDRIRYRVENILNILNNWRQELLEWHSVNEESFVRNYLLAAASMEGGTAGAIFEAAIELAVSLGESQPDVAGQRGPGILELTRLIGADISDDDRVEFSREGYADSVLDYFWSDRQHLRARFVEWLGTLPRNCAADRVVIANRVSQYVLRWTERQGDVELLRTVTNEWSIDADLRPVASDLVTAIALKDDKVGKKTRDDLLTFAKKRNTTSLQLLVATVCGGPWGLIHPRLALRRLGEIGQSSDEDVRQAVVEAMGSLWARQGTDRQVLDQVIKWCEEPVNRSLGATVFLGLAALSEGHTELPELARAESDRRVPTDQVIKGWRAVLDTRPPAAEEVLFSWLGAASRQSVFVTVLAKLFASAVGGWKPEEIDERRLVFLTSLLFRWAPEEDNASTDAESRAGVRNTIVSHVYGGVREPLRDSFETKVAVQYSQV